VFGFQKVEECTIRSLLDRLASQQLGLSGVWCCTASCDILY